MKTTERSRACIRIWLFILENGRTTAQEVAEFMRITTSQAHSRLASMARTGILQKYPRRNVPGSRTLFGVTAACGTPGGTPLGKLLEVARWGG